ncbi:hypothetical protein EUX98_g1938 [Antrodiella citrinella]|uniref:Uncharacterized protein n=1 Tax=Antrodiella citrinella TaxID=2447956 RepID=A0A4S4N389_9APHY|nr:hypothetical protein EUX98_g1938 [Antrodiella citrinella]
MPWKAIPTFFPSLVISASKSSLESVSLTLTDTTWARRGKPLTPPTQDEYWLFTEVDHALVNNFPRFRELAIDLCGTLPDGDDKVLKSLPKANALGHVRLGDIDENQLCVPFTVSVAFSTVHTYYSLILKTPTMGLALAAERPV